MPSGPVRFCQSSSTGGRGERVEEKNWVGAGGLPSICSGSPFRGIVLSWRRFSAKGEGVLVRFDEGWARWDRRGVAEGDDIDARIARLEIPFGQYGVDPYGISKKYLRLGMRILLTFYRSYFSVETSGLEHVPERGRAMLVGNHSGGFALDGAMVLAAMFFSKDPPRLAQGMVEKFINRVPFASQWASRIGQFTGL